MTAVKATVAPTPAYMRSLDFGTHGMVGIVRFDSIEAIAVFHVGPNRIGHYYGRTLTPAVFPPASTEGGAA